MIAYRPGSTAVGWWGDSYLGPSVPYVAYGGAFIIFHNLYCIIGHDSNMTFVFESTSEKKSK